MAKKATQSVSKTFVWIIVGLLCFAMVGFGASGLGGTVRTVGSVGERPIAVQDYVRAIQSEMNAFQSQAGTSITFAQAQAFGLERRALQQLVTAAALEHEAATLGLSIGDAALRDQLVQMRAFQGVDGQFDREAYRFALENAGISENQFEDDLRAESARTLLQGAVLSATPMPATYGRTMLGFVGETRNVTWARLDRFDLAEPLPEPDDAALRSHYDDNLATFTRPEIRAVTYAWITPDMLAASIDTPEDELRALYDDRADIFNQPERRLVERLPFLDTAAAEAALAELTAGTTDFDRLVTDRGLTLDDVDLGDVAAADLASEAATAVFAAEAGAVVGPVPSDLGPALFRVNAILDAQVTSFDDARADLLTELQRDRAARLIDGMAGQIEDLLAGGATLEEIATETEMELGQIDWSRDSDDDIAGYAAFGPAVSAAEPGDFPELAELSDGGLFAFRIDEVRAPEPIPFDEAREDVARAWASAETGRRLTAQAEELAAGLREGRTFVALSLAPNVETGLQRRGFLDNAPAGLIRDAFAMSLGEVRVLSEGDEAFLVRLDLIEAPDLASDDSVALLQTVDDQMSAAIAQDLFQALAADVQARAGIALDQQAINAVHTQFGGGAAAGN